MFVRNHFSALARQFDTGHAIFMDGPAGTQVPDAVIEAISAYYRQSNSNTHGAFTTTRETDQVIHSARSAMATVLGAEGGQNISFGQNMTSLNYALSAAIGRFLQPGDEILISQLDHEANRGPWISLRAQGIVVREIKLLADGTLDSDDMREKINERTRLLALGWASNLTGTVNDVRLARQLTYECGAWLLLDAVHYAPHFHIDVGEIGCDFLLCSAYKFYGPHVGILYTRTGILDRLSTNCLRTADQKAPYKIETGTLNHAALAGVEAAVRYIASYGHGENFRDQLKDAYDKLTSSERRLGKRLYDGLSKIPEVQIIGPDYSTPQRSPTLSFMLDNTTSGELCKYLSDHDIFAWSGHFYAIKAAEVLGLLEKGGVTRMGISGYTNEEEIDRIIQIVSQFVRRR